MLLKNDEVFTVHFNSGGYFTGKVIGQDTTGVALEALAGERWVWIPFTAVKQMEKVNKTHE